MLGPLGPLPVAVGPDAVGPDALGPLPVAVGPLPVAVGPLVTALVDGVVVGPPLLAQAAPTSVSATANVRAPKKRRCIVTSPFFLLLESLDSRASFLAQIGLADIV